MAGTGPSEGRDELDSVAKLVSLSETAPMPRIDGERPPLVTQPKSKPKPKPKSDPSGLYPEPAATPRTSGGGPATKPQSIAGELPSGLDAMFAAAGPEHETERPQTSPPVANQRHTRYVVIAGAVVVALAGLGTWALWPAPERGSAGRPAEVPVAPSKLSSAPPAVTTMTASPTPPTATDRVDHTTVRTIEGQKQPASEHPGAPHRTSAGTTSEDIWSSAVSSFLQDWSSRHQQPPGRHRG
ncbi:hypothetical protein AB0F91_19595 [Amycolatopsis sp. NPDC023774]|uniref:hypothetical protein n=1 Tax=Amycolatopsis sp. NPDC023774 TaxID=3155015 RepID=UPI00340661A2